MSTAKLIQPLASLTFLLAGSLSYAQPAAAAMFNGHFTQGLEGWQTSGDVSVQPGQPWGSSSPFSALLTTASARGWDDYPAPAGSYNFSGFDPTWIDFGPASMEDFLGIPRGSLPENSTHGSAFKQEITVQVGDILEFDWNFLTNERTPDYLDYAFVWLDGYRELANTSASFLPSATPFGRETGFQTFSHTFTQAGTYTLALGVVDRIDLDVSSGLLISNVRVTSSVSVPNSTPQLGLTLLGLGGLAAIFRKARS
ncbi:MAG: hypothetical protein LRZ84_19910 [Desertifilum sp.]|nr:hypothetical protein [Desertifilum sp.]